MSNRLIFSFYMNENLFGVDIILIREIISEPDITRVDLSPEMVRGLINLRGQIVTIIDPSVTMGTKKLDINLNTHCIILKTSDELASRIEAGDTIADTSDDIVGLLIDRIGEVYEVDESDIEPSPANLNGIDGNNLDGVIKLEKKLMMLLNVSHVLSR